MDNPIAIFISLSPTTYKPFTRNIIIWPISTHKNEERGGVGGALIQLGPTRVKTSSSEDRTYTIVFGFLMNFRGGYHRVYSWILWHTNKKTFNNNKKAKGNYIGAQDHQGPNKKKKTTINHKNNWIFGNPTSTYVCVGVWVASSFVRSCVGDVVIFHIYMFMLWIWQTRFIYSLLEKKTKRKPLLGFYHKYIMMGDESVVPGSSLIYFFGERERHESYPWIVTIIFFCRKLLLLLLLSPYIFWLWKDRRAKTRRTQKVDRRAKLTKPKHSIHKLGQTTTTTTTTKEIFVKEDFLFPLMGTEFVCVCVCACGFEKSPNVLMDLFGNILNSTVWRKECPSISLLEQPISCNVANNENFHHRCSDFWTNKSWLQNNQSILANTPEHVVQFGLFRTAVCSDNSTSAITNPILTNDGGFSWPFSLHRYE